jgi:hypothetical protein
VATGVRALQWRPSRSGRPDFPVHQQRVILTTLRQDRLPLATAPPPFEPPHLRLQLRDPSRRAIGVGVTPDGLLPASRIPETRGLASEHKRVARACGVSGGVDTSAPRSVWSGRAVTRANEQSALDFIHDRLADGATRACNISVEYACTVGAHRLATKDNRGSEQNDREGCPAGLATTDSQR